MTNDLMGRISRPGLGQRGRALMLAACILAMALLTSAGCNRPNESQAPPLPAVTVSLPLEKEVIEWDEYSGHLDSPQSVDLRARVSGLIVDAPFLEGSIIKKGTLLFAIDESSFKADLDAKKASVDQAEAQLALTRLTLNRVPTCSGSQFL